MPGRRRVWFSTSWLCSSDLLHSEKVHRDDENDDNDGSSGRIQSFSKICARMHQPVSVGELEMILPASCR